jgi:hypothetical protein
MRVSLDSNAWERIFGAEDRDCTLVRAALKDRRINGFICDASFRIEAVMKKHRAAYFAQPFMDVQCDQVTIQGKQYLRMSFGPNDSVHPGLPEAQAAKLQAALEAGIKLIRGQNWLGLPSPKEISDHANYVHEDIAASAKREQRQQDVAERIEARGVGRRAFDAAGGWEGLGNEEKKLIKACAEWADGELVSAHIAYENDVLCTNDHARGAGTSIFDAANRSWLISDFGVRFMTIDDLSAVV